MKRNKTISTSKEYAEHREKGAKNEIENENLKLSDRGQKLGFYSIKITEWVYLQHRERKIDFIGKGKGKDTKYWTSTRNIAIIKICEIYLNC